MNKNKNDLFLGFVKRLFDLEREGVNLSHRLRFPEELSDDDINKIIVKKRLMQDEINSIYRFVFGNQKIIVKKAAGKKKPKKRMNYNYEY